MKKIAVLTDSVSDIPDELVKKYNIKVVPLYLNFDDQSLKDGLEIEVEEVYSKLKSGKIIKSATPTIEDFAVAYRDLLDEQGFETIYSIHLSSLL